MATSHTERLETLLRAGNSASSSEFKAELTRLSASLKERQLRGSSSSVDFFTAAMTTLSKVKGKAYAELRLSCLLSCAHFLYTAGFTQGALRAARDLEALAITAQDKGWIRKARNISGIVNADIGNVSEALICYADALSVARETGEAEGELCVLNNLGGALIYGGLLREASLCFQRVASSEFTSPDVRKAVASAISNLAWVHLQREEYSQGIDAITRYIDLVSEPCDSDTALSRTIGEFLYVQLALGSGQLPLARARLDECIRFSRWGDCPRSTFLATIAEGLYAVHAGNVPRGISKLEEALEGTRELNHARVTCLSALVKAFDEAGQPERALHYLDELLNQVRSKREASIAALMDLPEVVGQKVRQSDTGRVETLERHEFRLRAVVAEREVAHSRIEMLERLAITANLKEDESGEHGYRVGKLARLLAAELKWDVAACVSLEFAARLHDVGKIAVPDRILFSSQTLKDAERHFVQTHTVIGAELLAKSNVKQLQIAEEIARCHHEWWDGSGYPSQLKHKRIPFHARIVALADVFDALTHGRPYSEAWPVDRALDEIQSRRGTQFDPELTDQFVSLVSRLRTEHPDLDGFLARAAADSPFAQARNKIREMLASEQANVSRPENDVAVAIP
jgi:putative two-component system response regulator